MRARLSLATVILAGACVAQRSPFTGLDVRAPDSTGHYRVLIGGHFHGTSTNRSGYPAATLLANLDTIATLDADLFLSTGDLFMDPVRDRPRYDRALFSKLTMPLFNAPGNHDVDGSVPVDPVEFDIPFDPGRSSDTIFYDRVLLLNTELDNGSLIGDQLGRLDALSDAIGLRNLFIVTHRPIWAEDDPRYGPLFEGNTRSLTGTNFKRDVYPLLEKIAGHAHVYWISGSMGGMVPAAIFFQEHTDGITFIQCAIRDEPRDALLIADVRPGAVQWSAISLTGQRLMAPERYDAAWWHANLGRSEGFNWRLLPLHVKNTVLSRTFWIGFATAALAALLLAWRRRRRA